MNTLDKSIGVSVLIESDWNLKYNIIYIIAVWNSVLIESDWNLKFIRLLLFCPPYNVLIESDWNLKLHVTDLANRNAICINRIRLEFKVDSVIRIS